MTGEATCSRGFSLIELLVAVAVLSVVIAIAYPAYTDFIQHGRRADATEALHNAATLQEQFYNDNKEYATDLSALNISSTTEQGYYQLSVTVTTTVDGSPQGYRLDAIAKGAQTGDTSCATIQLDSAGDKTPSDCW